MGDLDLRVGVVVVSHDSAEDLPACLDALAGAGAVADVVVVDNASRDGSPSVVRGHPRARLVEAPGNLGFAGGCNLGFAALSDDLPVVVFMNPDVVVEADCLARCARRLDERPELAGVAPRLMRPDRVTVDSVGQVLKRPTLEVRDRGYGAPMHAELAREQEVLAPCGALAVYRRRALVDVADGDGPFAEFYFCFWEDLELGWRLVNRGWHIVTEPTAVAVHGRGAGARPGRGPLRWRRPPELEACILSNRWMTLIRCLHPRDLWTRLPLLAAWDLCLVTAGVLRRPQLAGLLARRMKLVRREWRSRHRRERRRLAELPW